MNKSRIFSRDEDEKPMNNGIYPPCAAHHNHGFHNANALTKTDQ
ncbi:hypothetical protein [Veronia pacifica]|nr:hypothetical protein [Veronia pacifica]